MTTILIFRLPTLGIGTKIAFHSGQYFCEQDHYYNLIDVCLLKKLLYKLYRISDDLLIQRNKKIEAQPRPCLFLWISKSSEILWEEPRSHPINLASQTWITSPMWNKLDGVGPVDNRPSTDKLHHFVQKKKSKMTCDTCHVSRDMFGGGEHSLKISAP